MWEQLTEFLSQFFDKKVVVIIVTILSLLYAAVVILSKTSIGKKALNELRALGHRTEQTARDTLEKVESYKKHAEEEFAAYKAECDRKVAVAISCFSYFESSILDAVSQIPNKKVQERVQEITEQYLEKKQVLEEEFGFIYDDFEIAVQQRADQIEKEYAKKYQEINAQIENLKLQIQPFSKPIDEILDTVQPVEEEVYEQEENTDPTKEDL